MGKQVQNARPWPSHGHVKVAVCNENGLEVFGGCAASVTGRVSSSTSYGTDLRREPIEVRKATFASLFRLASRSYGWLPRGC
jgi:hypothetical protein